MLSFVTFQFKPSLFEPAAQILRVASRCIDRRGMSSSRYIGQSRSSISKSVYGVLKRLRENATCLTGRGHHPHNRFVPFLCRPRSSERGLRSPAGFAAPPEGKAGVFPLPVLYFVPNTGALTITPRGLAVLVYKGTFENSPGTGLLPFDRHVFSSFREAVFIAAGEASWCMASPSALRTFRTATHPAWFDPFPLVVPKDAGTVG